MRGTRWFVATMLAPAFFFLVCFYIYPTVFNIANSLTDLSLFGLKRGGAWVGVDNYLELLALVFPVPRARARAGREKPRHFGSWRDDVESVRERHVTPTRKTNRIGSGRL